MTFTLTGNQLVVGADDDDDDDDADDLGPQDERLQRLVKEFGSNSWSSVSLHFKVSSETQTADHLLTT